MAAPTNAANVKKALANSEPSTHGHEGDITELHANVCTGARSARRGDLTKSGERLCMSACTVDVPVY
jgi:hypothetical protein